MEDEKWTPIKALGRARKSISELAINELVIDKSDKPELMFSQVYNANNEKLEEFLVMYFDVYIYPVKQNWDRVSTPTVVSHGVNFTPWRYYENI